jgi:hypothetical protein
MELQASQAGVLSGAAFALVACTSALIVRRLPAARQKWGRPLLLFALVVVALFVPPPLLLLGRTGAVEIVNAGHAGLAFVAPYFAVCAVAIIAAAVLVRSRGKG